MAAAVTDAAVATDSLAKIPDNISVSQLPDAKNISGRSLERDLNYYTQGYIQDIRITPGVNEESFVVARCWRSMKKNESPHKLQLGIKDGTINYPHCTCKTGEGGYCSYIVGLVKQVQGFKLHNFTHIPDQLSCTSVPQQWHIPRGIKIKPVSVNSVIVARPLENRKRKPVVCQQDSNFRMVRSQTCLQRPLAIDHLMDKESNADSCLSFLHYFHSTMHDQQS